MKEMLRKLFFPILTYFEKGEGEYSYKQSHRLVLVVVGSLFTGLSVSIFVAGIVFSQIGAVVPGLVFSLVGVTCLVVGSLGSDRAVSKIWGNK